MRDVSLLSAGRKRKGVLQLLGKGSKSQWEMQGISGAVKEEKHENKLGFLYEAHVFRHVQMQRLRTGRAYAGIGRHLHMQGMRRCDASYVSGSSAGIY